MNTKALQRQLIAAVAMLLVAAIALGSSTYAWFVNNTAVVAEGIDITATSATPNLYITATGKTSDNVTAVSTNPEKAVPVSTANGTTWYQEASWTTVAATSGDQYTQAVNAYKAMDTSKPAYFEYTVKLGVTTGSMDIYLNTAEAVTTLTSAAGKGQAARMAIKWGDATTWTMFKVPGTATSNGHYTDSTIVNTGSGDYWIAGTDADTAKPATATYTTLAAKGATVANNVTTAGASASALGTITQGTEVTVTIRIWLEGCDKDCVVGIADDASIAKGNIGFCGIPKTT